MVRACPPPPPRPYLVLSHATGTSDPESKFRPFALLFMRRCEDLQEPACVLVATEEDDYYW